jgi:tRNA G18 (ribose-2'-O)-methylase SpoU
VPIEITDPGDPRIELYCGLRDADLRRRVESRHGVFVAEGILAVRRLLGSHWPVRSLLVRPERLAAMADTAHAAEQVGVPVYVAGESVFDHIAGYPVHRGVLALGERQPERHPADVLCGAQMVVILEGLNDHENIGAIFRNAAAFGASAVLLDPTCGDPLYRRSVRVSAGHVLSVPFARLAPWPNALRLVRRAGFSVVALHPAATETLESQRPDGPLALMVGAEGPGLTPAARAEATAQVRIDTTVQVDSLNVATALAIALYRWSPTGRYRQA